MDTGKSWTRTGAGLIRIFGVHADTYIRKLKLFLIQIYVYFNTYVFFLMEIINNMSLSNADNVI